ncbi:MAG: MbtH domain protein [Kiritimatiellae bacterium]|nr:MbtH domain protein [Kiritimatiellia bacterium]
MDELVERLSKGNHPVEAGLRPERTVEELKAAIDRGYVHVKFTATRGGTELGVRLDMDASDFSKADFDQGKGPVHLEGGLTLNYLKVRCISDLDLETLEGKGHLDIVEEMSP